jgi:formiminotetrahydrofolate cyclodeaminase
VSESNTSNSKPETSNLKSELSGSTGTFAELVASGNPTPGGGSVAAYSGVLAAALGRMVCNLTAGKKKYEQVESRVREIEAELNGLATRLGELVDEDAASFDAVMQAYRLPKENDEQKTERNCQIESAGRGAISVPLETARSSVEVLKLLKELGAIGNTNAFSDVTVGSQLARTAVKGAYYNVGVNLGMLPEEESQNIRRQILDIVTEAETIADEIETDMLARMQ